MRERANADGECPFCAVDLDIELWPSPNQAALDDDQLIEIARKAAVDSVHRYFYMPATTEDAKSWLPHRWVIEAMRAAAEYKS